MLSANHSILISPLVIKRQVFLTNILYLNNSILISRDMKNMHLFLLNMNENNEICTYYYKLCE